ncbi:alpha/beta fold hydrolase [Ferrimicrobium acidiphilum]|uniref:alpha/beta fold hydrolase n=1 Tax=Ferrimicrobium acidiphilum TaxID=121039 RepID=UPI0023F32150|nr:alpha/beta hydrolase [Ferrimicrobium acidiphilum]
MALNQLKLSDGRRFEYFDSGPDRRYTVIAHHGTPGAGVPMNYELANAAELGVRLIFPTRPGYASSSRDPGRSVASVASDIKELLDYLEIATCACYGTSGGGPHALACGALLPDRVVAVASLSGVGAYGQDDLEFFEGMGDDNLDEFGLALQGADDLSQYLNQAREAMVAADVDSIVATMATLLTPVDVAAIRHLGKEIVDDFDHALSNGIDGWLDDDLAFVKPWGFELDAMTTPVQIWQGDQDLMVPVQHSSWLANHIHSSELLRLPDEGHLSTPLHNSTKILSWLKGHLRDNL